MIFATKWQVFRCQRSVSKICRLAITGSVFTLQGDIGNAVKVGHGNALSTLSSGQPLRRRLPSSGTAPDSVFDIVPYFKILRCKRVSRWSVSALSTVIR